MLSLCWFSLRSILNPVSSSLIICMPCLFFFQHNNAARNWTIKFLCLFIFYPLIWGLAFGAYNFSWNGNATTYVPGFHLSIWIRCLNSFIYEGETKKWLKKGKPCTSSPALQTPPYVWTRALIIHKKESPDQMNFEGNMSVTNKTYMQLVDPNFC